MRKSDSLGLACCRGADVGARRLRPRSSETLSIVVFGPPSLGAFLPPVIKAQKLDEKNGLSITFEERTPDAYTAQFNSGEFQLGGSASLLTVGLADIRGVKVTYLFNLFDFWGTVVTSRPEVKIAKGSRRQGPRGGQGHHQLRDVRLVRAPARRRHRKFSVVNTATPGLVGYALADRATAVQLWEPAYTTLLAKKPDIRTIDLKIAESWKKVDRQHEHPLSRRRRPYRLGGEEPEPDPETLRRLQGSRRMDRGASRRCRQADHAPRERRRRPQGDRRTHSRQ